MESPTSRSRSTRPLTKLGYPGPGQVSITRNPLGRNFVGQMIGPDGHEIADNRGWLSLLSQITRYSQSPLSSAALIEAMALSASSLFGISTKPNPRLSPLNLSLMIEEDAASSKAAKASRRSLSLRFRERFPAQMLRRGNCAPSAKTKCRSSPSEDQ
jgi:hypothetical protein